METILALSTGPNYNMEEVVAAVTGPLWFELYPLKKREDIALLVERAQKAGYKALYICVDVAAPGKRERDLRNKANVAPQDSWNKVVHSTSTLVTPSLLVRTSDVFREYRGLRVFPWNVP